MMRMTLGLWCNGFTTITHQIITHLITRPRLPRLQCSLYAKQLTFVGMATTVLNLAFKLLPIKNSYMRNYTEDDDPEKYSIEGGPKADLRASPPIPILFNFMQFLGNIDPNIRLAAPLVLASDVSEIPDPSQFLISTNIMSLDSFKLLTKTTLS